MQNVQYKDKIVQRLGGELAFDFLNLSYCERIYDDKFLKKIFGNFSLEKLAFFQKELLLIAFMEPIDADKTKALEKRVSFRIELMGLERSHFDILEKLFHLSLLDCWVQGEDLKICKNLFGALRPFFKTKKEVEYKDDLISKMGGGAMLNFLNISYSQKLVTDPRLAKFFGNFDLQSLVNLQKDMIMMAFLKPSSQTELDALKRKVCLRFHRLFEMGLNETHFDIMEQHFSCAITGCFADQSTIELSKEHFGSLRRFFQENGIAVSQMGDRRQMEIDSLTDSVRNARRNQFLRSRGSVRRSRSGVRSLGDSERSAGDSVGSTQSTDLGGTQKSKKSDIVFSWKGISIPKITRRQCYHQT